MKDTIAAIATGRNASGISIIRISGESAVDIADKLFRNKEKKRQFKPAKTHTLKYGFIACAQNDDILDEIIVSTMLAPKSYTGEDVVEINCHGGILITNRILEEVLKAGARLAEPGEFTKRAFLNGRIDLSQAEAVMDLIDAKSRAAVKNSELQLRGSLREAIEKISSEILHETAFIEAALDDPEHFDLTGYKEELKGKTEKVLAGIDRLIKGYDEGSVIKNGIRCAILGKPNVGKSTFMNLLAGQEKAIVTDIAGTTRDTLEQSVTLRGIELLMIDTAGIRDSLDPVEKIGIDRALAAGESADLIIYMADSSVSFDDEDLEILRGFSDKRCIILLNKSDLTPVCTKEIIEDKLKSCGFADTDIRVIPISAKENTGTEEFKDLVESMFLSGLIRDEDEAVITNIRHKQALEDARTSLLNVLESIDKDMPEDFYSIDLTDAYKSLGMITGKDVGEDLIEEIFSKFCMGK